MPVETSTFDLRLVNELLGVQRARFDVDHVAVCDSTNTQLLARAQAGSGAGTVLLADQQTAGRGRRDRKWISAPDCGLTFSLLWRFARTQRLEGLSLAVGLAIVRGLEALGVADLALKWPNDIWLAGRKLGGVLVEVAQGPRGDTACVIGIGLNMRAQPDWDAALAKSSAALDASGHDLSREKVLASILQAMLTVLERFGQQGFAALVEDWLAYHAMRGAEVSVEQSGLVQTGRCGVVDALGRLEVDTSAGLIRVFGGEVSLRRLDPPKV